MSPPGLAFAVLPQFVSRDAWSIHSRSAWTREARQLRQGSEWEEGEGPRCMEREGETDRERAYETGDDWVRQKATSADARVEDAQMGKHDSDMEMPTRERQGREGKGFVLELPKKAGRVATSVPR
jgi:hypothetical protein